MTRYLLDTNICVFHLRGKLNLKDYAGEQWRTACCISEVTALELYYGAANSDHPAKHHAAVDIFLEGLTALPVVDCAGVYAGEKVRFNRAGMPLNDEFDLIIGSSAITRDLILVTDNVKHFKNFQGIKIENWMKKK
jgi:tRNA(fMet)-specific endonuclease VapC